MIFELQNVMYRCLPLTTLHLFVKYENCSSSLKNTEVIVSEPTEVIVSEPTEVIVSEPTEVIVSEPKC